MVWGRSPSPSPPVRHGRNESGELRASLQSSSTYDATGTPADQPSSLARCFSVTTPCLLSIMTWQQPVMVHYPEILPGLLLALACPVLQGLLYAILS